MMNEHEWNELHVSLTEKIRSWIEGIAYEDRYDIGFWYDEQAGDMAAAALSVLKGSQRGQAFAEKQVQP